MVHGEKWIWVKMKPLEKHVFVLGSGSICQSILALSLDPQPNIILRVGGGMASFGKDVISHLDVSEDMTQTQNTTHTKVRTLCDVFKGDQGSMPRGHAH